MEALVAETLNQKQMAQDGKDAYSRGDYETAIKRFQAAAEGYASVGDKLSEAEMLNNCGVAHLRKGNGATALQAIEGTPATFAAAGDIRRQGLALGNLGDALESLGRKQEAGQAYEQSAELLEQSGEEEMRAHVLQALSKLQLKSGRQIEALATMEAGLEGFKKPSLKQRLLKKLLRIPFKMMGS
jgi:tetratricopeptide (TPR) repeat protein